MHWLYPPNQEHPNVNQRLDILGVYGPVVAAHSVDKCYCVSCTKVCKQYLAQKTLQNQQESTNNQVSKNNSLVSSKSNQKIQNKCNIQLPPLRLIDEEGYECLKDKLCMSCRNHSEQLVHLPSGRQGLHLMTDAELKLLGQEQNQQDLLDLLRVEKGKAADLMLGQIDTTGDHMFQHDPNTIRTLLSTLPTDYYGRYDFTALQNVILEDRRIRMVKWVSIIVEKPVHRFANPKAFDQTVLQSVRADPNSIHFTLKRTLPLSMTIKPHNPAYTKMELEPSILDYKKLLKNQEMNARNRRNHKYSHRAVNIDEVNKPNYTGHLILLRDYQEGRHGDWNNYVCLKAQNKGTYVQTRNYTHQPTS